MKFTFAGVGQGNNFFCLLKGGMTENHYFSGRDGNVGFNKMDIQDPQQIRLGDFGDPNISFLQQIKYKYIFYCS